jgi:peroxiredoxin
MIVNTPKEPVPEQRLVENGSGSFGDTESSSSSRHGPADLQVLKGVRLFPISFHFNEVAVDHKFKESLRSIVRMECDKAKAKVLILYAARHPATGCCRREGRALANLAFKLGDVAFVTVVKDITEIKESVAEYHEQYCLQSPIYQDPKMDIYKAFGSKKIPFWSLIRGTTKLMVRARKQGITINFADLQRSDLFIQGGVLVFRDTGTLFYSMTEPSVGKSIDIGELEKVVQRCRLCCRKRRHAQDSSEIVR